MKYNKYGPPLYAAVKRSSFENFKNSCPGLQNPSEAQRKEHEKYEFALHEVYAVDVLISSGEGQVENFSDNKIFTLLF